MAEALQHLFALVCGQSAAHTWAPGGVLMPCCERCTGFYAGALVAGALHLALRIRPRARFLQVHGLFLLQMIPLGFHWVTQGALVRTWSGLLYGFGVVSFLWLLPGARWTRVGEADNHTLWRYGVGVSLVLGAVPAMAVWGGVLAGGVLTAAALGGLVLVAALAAANLALGVGWLVGWRARARRGLA